ncbi:MAG TPA: DUF6073 family protein [Thermoanaerobaculia bacterium]|nr:DUF6073 family protein [Thermoanaerobaculia bacterium]
MRIWIVLGVVMAACLGTGYAVRLDETTNPVAKSMHSPPPVPVSSKRAVGPAVLTTDGKRIAGLLAEMKTVSLASLEPLRVKPFTLPAAGVDVMRVRMEETYDIAGVGKDTVELTGWIAVTHDNPRPAEGESTVTWSSAVSDTSFVGMDLHGNSSIFGPVEVGLDPRSPSTGQVGKLAIPFIKQVSLDAAYRPYRLTDARRSYLPIGRAPSGQPKAGKKYDRQPASQAAVTAVLKGVLKAIENKDAEGMLRYYSKSTSAIFFGVTPEVATHGGEAYVKALSAMFANIRSIKPVPDDDIQVKVSGNLAVASLTGTNVVVDNQGRRGSSPWRWTVQLEKADGGWMITHDHLSLVEDQNAPEDQRFRGPEAGRECLASLSVTIRMPELDLRMATQHPVNWYSEVETIPPVGYTASVSMTPTPLLSAGRVIGSLEHGVVKFREVVKHVALRGTEATRMAGVAAR